jgi:hypothetical protein
MVQDEQFPFQFEKWIEISDRQRFLIVVNMRNGPFWRLVQDSLSLLWLKKEMVRTVIP